MTAPLDPEAQSEILSEIVERLVFALPPGWKRVHVDYAAVGEHVVCVGLLFMVNDAMSGWTPPEDVLEKFTRLRTGMARPGRGTWLHALLRLDYPDLYSIEYDRDALPRFKVPPPPEEIARELETFPRDEEHVQEWMRTASGSS
jgi:hypothetical protein